MKIAPGFSYFRLECLPPAHMGEGLQQVFLELTPACNSKCPGCLNESFIADFSPRQLKHEFRRPPLNKANWLALFSRLPASVTTVILSGGEPTLHPDFTEILQELENRELAFIIFSNGRWPDPEGLIDQLKQSPAFKGFLISLHGASAATHENFSGIAGSFSETVHNVRLATAAGLPVTLSTVITRRNLAELAQMPGLAQELGAEELSFNRYLYTPERVMLGGELIDAPTPPDLQLAIREIELMHQQYAEYLQIGYGPTIPQCFEPSVSQGCSAGETSLVIDPWGNVKPCLHTDLLCGNLLQQDFATIWNSEPLQMWRGLTTSGCSTCSAFSQCGGGCRAMALSWGQGQDPLMQVPLIHDIPLLATLPEMVLEPVALV